jgi:uncharacterized membrane protein YdjX (TVP38/TMEM64 family)
MLWIDTQRFRPWIMPYNNRDLKSCFYYALNYLAGITAISLKDYSLALLGMLPGTIVYVFLGASAGSLAEIQARDQTASISGLTIGIIVVGIISGVTAIGLTSYYAKQEFQRALEARQQEIG